MANEERQLLASTGVEESNRPVVKRDREGTCRPD